jgi:hypothetical protein
MSKTCIRLLSLALLGVLALGGVTGTAVAKAKIKGKQIAPNAIAAKHLKTGAVTTDKLAPGAVTGTKLAAGAVTGDKLAAGAVTGDKLAANTVTGAQVNEATLGRVPDAAAIAGRTVTPIAMDLPNTQASAITVASGPGWTLGLDCATTQLNIQFNKTGSSSLVTTTFLTDGQPPLITVASGNNTLATAGVGSELHLVSVTGGTGTVEVQLTGAFSAGQFGSQKDCYYRGTVTTTP